LFQIFGIKFSESYKSLVKIEKKKENWPNINKNNRFDCLLTTSLRKPQVIHFTTNYQPLTKHLRTTYLYMW